MHLRRTFPVPATLTRMALALALCWLLTLAGAAPAAAQIDIEIVNPGSLAFTDPVDVFAYVTSPSEITSVQAAVGTRTATLTRLSGNGWWGAISLVGLPIGQKQIVVTATNAASQTGQATRVFSYEKPLLIVTSPAAHAVANPDLRVSARCNDAVPDCLISVKMYYDDFSNPPAVLAGGIGSVDTIVSPPDGLGRLIFSVVGAFGPRAEIVRPIIVLSSPRYRSVASYSGRILDISSDRALIADDSVIPRVVRIVDRATNTSQIIWIGRPEVTDWPDRAESGFLTPSGALVVSRDFDVGNPQRTYLHEWRGGTLTDLGVIGTVNVNGTWALYSQTSTLPPQLILRNLISGANAVVDSQSVNASVVLTPDGRVVYSDYTSDTTVEIFRWEPGPPPVTTQLTSGAPAWSMAPVTDGVNIVYVKVPKPSQDPASVILRTGDGTEIVLAAGTYNISRLVANGWVAFVRAAVDGTQELWLRAPDGTEQRLFVVRAAISLETLSDTGEVFFSENKSGHRYIARPDGTLVDLGHRTGTPVQIDGELHLIAGSQLLALDTEAPSRSILSEGATGTFFTTDVALLNPHDSAVPVTIRYLREDAPALQQTRTLPAMSRTTIHADDVPGLEGTSVSTVVDAPGPTPVVVERLMSWDATGYGGHLGTSVDRPRPRWMFAEGAQGFFYTFFLIANSSTDEASVKFTFLLEGGTPVTHTIDVAPGTRKTVHAGDVADLINRSFATVIESDVPIVAERAMYFGDAPLWLGGHGSAGVPEPALNWFHAEGATGSLFDTFILLANPHSVDVPVKVTYVTDAGQVIERPRTLPASSRLTINIENEAPELANVSVSTRVESTYPIVSERAMYWGTTGSGWREAHNSFGVPETGTKWALAEGRTGGPRGYQTFVLVSNTSANAAVLRITFVKEDGTTVVRTPSVSASQRHTIDTGGIPELANTNFSTIVESTNGVPISVESAIYWSVNGVIWEGGGNTVGTRLQ